MYDLSMHDLEIILAVAEAGSFRRAALQMGKGQSAVSRRVQRLEDEFGASIFERRSTGARLTNAGVLFVESSRRILREYQAAFASVRSAGTVHEGALRIGMIASLSKGVFREIVADFKNRHPDIDVHFVESERGDLLTRLEHSELDAVFASGEAQPGKDDCLLVVREPIFVAMRSECEFSKASRLGWRQISEEHFVISDQEPGPDIHSYVVRRAGDLGRQIRATRFGVGREGIMTLVGLGFGVSVVADHWRGVSYPNVSFVPVGTVGETVPFSLWWKQENDNPALRRFLSITRIQARRAQSSSAPL